MIVKILLFAGVRDRAGRDTLEVEIPTGTTAAGLLARLAERFPDLAGPLSACRVAVDQSFVAADHRIEEAEEIAVIPPVSGGHDGPPAPEGAPARIRLTTRSLELAEVVGAVAHARAGGIATFLGNVRRDSRGETVDHLVYEAYAPMARRVMREIADRVERGVPGARVAIHHRLGRLAVGETAVIIAAAAAHRAEAFVACREAIEALKREVPIWKREVAVDGRSWYGRGP